MSDFDPKELLKKSGKLPEGVVRSADPAQAMMLTLLMRNNDQMDDQTRRLTRIETQTSETNGRLLKLETWKREQEDRYISQQAVNKEYARLWKIPSKVGTTVSDYSGLIKIGAALVLLWTAILTWLKTYWTHL